MTREDLNKKARNREERKRGGGEDRGTRKTKREGGRRMEGEGERSVAEHEGGEEGTCRE